MITENNNYQQVARENCSGVIMTFSCVAIILIPIARTNVRALSIIRFSKLARFD